MSLDFTVMPDYEIGIQSGLDGDRREVLDAYGLSSSGWNDNRVEGTINAKLSQAQRALNDIDALNENADVERENIRAYRLSE